VVRLAQRRLRAADRRSDCYAQRRAIGGPYRQARAAMRANCVQPRPRKHRSLCTRHRSPAPSTSTGSPAHTGIFQPDPSSRRFGGALPGDSVRFIPTRSHGYWSRECRAMTSTAHNVTYVKVRQAVSSSRSPAVPQQTQSGPRQASRSERVQPRPPRVLRGAMSANPA